MSIQSPITSFARSFHSTDSEEEEDDVVGETLASFPPSTTLHRMPSADSSLGFLSEAPEAWICPQCSYTNGDGKDVQCALCGNDDTAHLPQKYKHRRTVDDNTLNTPLRKNKSGGHSQSLLTVTSTTTPSSLSKPPQSPQSESSGPSTSPVTPESPADDQASLPLAAAECIIPPLVDRRSMLISSNSSHSVPTVVRPSAEEDDDVLSQPSRPSSSRKASTKRHASLTNAVTTQSTPSQPMVVGPSLTGSSLGALVRHVSKEKDRIEREKEQNSHKRSISMDTVSVAASTVTAHSRRTIKTSNRSLHEKQKHEVVAGTIPNVLSPSTTALSASASSLELSSSSLQMNMPLGDASIISPQFPINSLSSSSESATRSLPLQPEANKNVSDVGSVHQTSSSNTSEIFTISEDREQASHASGSKKHGAAASFPTSSTFSASRTPKPQSSSRLPHRASAHTLVPPVRKESATPMIHVTMVGETGDNPSETQSVPSSSRKHTHYPNRSSQSVGGRTKTWSERRSNEHHKALNEPISYTIQTPTTSFASVPSTYTDEPTGEHDRLERGFGAHEDHGDAISYSGRRQTNGKQFGLQWIRDKFGLPRVIQMGLLMVVIFLAVALIVLLSRGKKRSSSDSATPVAPGNNQPPTFPEKFKLELAATLNGDSTDSLGTSVSAGGPLGDWFAIVGSETVRVKRYNPTRSVLEDVGSPVTYPSTVSRVSLSAERRRMAVAHGGQLSVLERGNIDGDWRDIMNTTKIGEWQNLIEDKAEIATSCSISGSGLIVVGAAVLHTTKGSFVNIRSFELETETSNLPVAPVSFPVNPSSQTILTDLSYDGKILAVLSDSLVRIYRKSEAGGWVLVDGQEIFAASADRTISAMALSGNGAFIALTTFDQTAIYECDAPGVRWTQSDVILSGGSDLSLSYEGDFLLLGIALDPSEHGKIVLWRRQDGSFINADEKKGDSPSSMFGSSVSIPKNRIWGLIAVGAPTEGNSESGSVSVYKETII